MYQEQILEHYKDPHNTGKLPHPTHQHHSHNPLCGDEITIQLHVEEGTIQNVKFQGQGCALSVASTSLLTDELQGKSVEEAKNLTKDNILELLGIPVGPVRLKCVLLGLETLHQALGEKDL